MQTWSEARKGIKSLTEEEKENFALISDIISKIVERRNELHLSQRDLAEITGIKQSAIARFETMGNQPQLSTFLQIIRPLGLQLKLVATESGEVSDGCIPGQYRTP